MSRLFRGKMVSALRQAYQAGDLNRITHAGEVSRNKWGQYKLISAVGRISAVRPPILNSSSKLTRHAIRQYLG